MSQSQLVFKLTLDDSNFNNRIQQAFAKVKGGSVALQQSSIQVQNFQDKFKSAGAEIERSFGSLTKAATAFFSVSLATQFTQKIIEVRTELQTTELAFGAFLGSANKGKALMDEIREFSANSILSISALSKSAQTLLGFNVAAEKIMPTLRTLGDISQGNEERMKALTLAYAQCQAAGRLMGQDLNQMINAGFNPLMIISEETGKKVGDLKKEMEEGGVSSEMVADAFKKATSEGGRFYGMMDVQSSKLKGDMNKLNAAFINAYDGIGASLEGVVGRGAKMARTLVENYETIGAALTYLISVYGVYKTAVMAVNAHQKAISTVAYNAEIIELEKLLQIKAANNNEDLKKAVTEGKLSSLQAGKIASLRAEANAHLEVLRNTMLSDKANVERAKSVYLEASKAKAVAKERVALAQAEVQSAIASGSVMDIQRAKTEALTAKKHLNTTAIAKNNAHKILSATTSKAVASQEAFETLSSNLNTTAKVGQTKATKVLTVAKYHLTRASKALGLSMLANPYLLVAAAVVGLSYGLYKLITHQTNAEKAQKKLNEALADGKSKIQSETENVDFLFDRLNSLEKGTEEWFNARQSIIDQYGEYLKKLGDEETALKDLGKAHIFVREEAEKAAQSRFLHGKAREFMDEKNNKVYEAKMKISKAINDEKTITSQDLKNYVKKVFSEATEKEDGIKYVNEKIGELIKEGKRERATALSTILNYSQAGTRTPWGKTARNFLSDIKEAKEAYQIEINGLTEEFGSITKKANNSIKQSLESLDLGQLTTKNQSLRASIKIGKENGRDTSKDEEELSRIESRMQSLEKTEIKTLSSAEAHKKKLEDIRKNLVIGSSEYESYTRRIEYLNTLIGKTSYGNKVKETEKAIGEEPKNKLEKLKQQLTKTEVEIKNTESKIKNADESSKTAYVLYLDRLKQSKDALINQIRLVIDELAKITKAETSVRVKIDEATFKASVDEAKKELLGIKLGLPQNGVLQALNNDQSKRLSKEKTKPKSKLDLELNEILGLNKKVVPIGELLFPDGLKNPNKNAKLLAENLKKIKRESRDLAQEAQQISRAFTTIGNVFSRSGDDATAWALNTIGAIADVVPEIEKLIGARKAEALANGVSQASLHPFPANLGAIATIVATITSVFASIPKFEKGGIVGGSSFFGDKLLARVNSGEMILNIEQQQKLGKMLFNNRPQSTQVNIGVDKVRGADLFLTLKNYMNKTGKKL